MVYKYLSDNIDNKSVCKLVSKALSKKLNNSGNVIGFYKPGKTIAVSVTGDKCKLNCAHCGGHYLKSMTPIDFAYREALKAGADSCLISGGCDINGRVEFDCYTDEIIKLKDNYKINLHIGLPEKRDIELVSRLADVVSLDIPVSDAVIREVYGLGFHVENYLDMYLKLREKVRVVPHICIGLDKGIESELSIVEMLRETAPQDLCFIVFVPTINTRFEGRREPEILSVIEVLANARIKLPDTNIILGCMRPGGAYRKKLDNLAVISGINGLVMPMPSAVVQAELMGLKAVWMEECCAFQAERYLFESRNLKN